MKLEYFSTPYSPVICYMLQNVGFPYIKHFPNEFGSPNAAPSAPALRCRKKRRVGLGNICPSVCASADALGALCLSLCLHLVLEGSAGFALMWVECW